MPTDDEPEPPEAESAGTPAAEGASTAADPEAEAEPVSDLRAKDLIGRSTAELQAELDPATMAELASWFLRPSVADAPRVHPAAANAGIGGPSEPELDEFERLGAAMGMLDEDRTAARTAAMAAVIPSMIDLLDRHTRAAAAILPTRAEPRLVLDETILPRSLLALLPEGDEAAAVAEPRAYERSRDIDQLLEQDNAPQAVLRDLNRPVEEFERRMEPAFPPPSPEEDLTFAIRDALRWRPPPVPFIPRPPDFRAEWKPLLAARWAELAAQAKEIRKAETEAADAQAAADAANGIVWRF